MRLLLAVALPLLVGYALTLVWIWDNWMLEESYYSHGPLIPALIIGLIWFRREALAELPAGTEARAWWILGPGLLLHLCGAGLMVDSLSALSLCLTVPGAVLLAQGVPRWRLLLPVLGLIVFAVPMPMFVTGKLVFVLKEVAVSAGVGLGNLLGAGATRSGANLMVPNESTPLVVADACGGLRSLVSLLTVGYVIAFFLSRSNGLGRWVLLALAVPVALLSNVVRIAAMCVMSAFWGVEFGSTTGHDIAGVAVFVAAVVALLAVDGWIGKRAAA